MANAVTGFAPRKVVALLHSTGALVFRAFLAAHPELAGSFEQVLAFGGSWCGTIDFKWDGGSRQGIAVSFRSP